MHVSVLEVRGLVRLRDGYLKVTIGEGVGRWTDCIAPPPAIPIHRAEASWYTNSTRTYRFSWPCSESGFRAVFQQ